MSITTLTEKNNPALTYTLTDFIKMGSQDESTYRNFSILSYRMETEFVDQNILDYYIDELKALCLKITKFDNDQIIKYRYSPDLLAYDIYGSTQLDFIVLLCNGIVDPKDFDFKRGYILLPSSSVLKEFLSQVYSSESNWMDLNRTEINQAKNV